LKSTALLTENVAFRHYCERGPYDLVVTDYFHPGMDGLELSRAIRKKNPTQAIAGFTGGGSKQMSRSFERLHIPVLVKPSNELEIVRFFKNAIARKPKRKKQNAQRH
jgi:CheY-like chemotaxis protein